MGFSAKQLQALRRQPNRSHIRTREAHGRELTYLEGWYAISEANRIFGFDGWNRETIESKCVLARENRGTFLAVYTARVRVTVHADGATIIREGHGTGEGHGTSPGEVHDIALKVAETDATKRALATFGKPFGLELYRGGKKGSSQKALPSQTTVTGPAAPCPLMPASASIRTTRPLFRGHRVTMAAVRIWSRGLVGQPKDPCTGDCQGSLGANAPKSAVENTRRLMKMLLRPETDGNAKPDCGEHEEDRLHLRRNLAIGEIVSRYSQTSALSLTP
jgi:hypothetical protein